MKSKFAQESFTGLPQWAKGIIAVAVVGGVGFIIYKLYTKVKSEADKKDVKVVVNENLAEYEKLAKTEKLSKPIPAYQQAINDIVTKLTGCEDFRTELQAIESIIKVVKKPIDWYYLVAKFGNKDIDDCGWGKTNYDFPTLLKDQLDTSGVYSIDFDGWKKSGFATNSIDILKSYLSKVGVTI